MTAVITDPGFYLIAIPAVIALGLSKGGFAGIGMAATPLVALVLPPLEAAALILPLLISQDILSMWIYRKTWDARNLKILIPGAAIGIVIAWLLAARISDAQVRVAIGLIALVFVLNGWFGRTPPPTDRPPPVGRGVFWGIVAGFTSTFAQAGSPPFQVYVLPQRLDKLVFVGTATIFFFFVNVMKIVPYFSLGQFSTKNFATSVLLLPVAVVANFIGVWLVRRTPQALFYRISYVLVFIVALELLRSGILGMWPGR